MSNYMMETPGNESDSELRSMHFKLPSCVLVDASILCQMHVRAYNVCTIESVDAALKTVHVHGCCHSHGYTCVCVCVCACVCMQVCKSLCVYLCIPCALKYALACFCCVVVFAMYIPSSKTWTEARSLSNAPQSMHRSYIVWLWDNKHI